LACAILACVGATGAFGQIDGPIEVPAGTRLNQVSSELLRHVISSLPAAAGTAKAPAGGGSLPLWSYSVKSTRDSNTYGGTIVGGSPLVAGAGTTTVPVVIIPVILKFSYLFSSTYIFDPTATDAGCIGTGNTALSLTQGSPLFSPTPFAINGVSDGATEYADAFLRGEFGLPSSSSFHLSLPATVMPAQTVTLSASNTRFANATVFVLSGQCGKNTGSTNLPGYLGVVNINTIDPTLERIITTLGLGPNQFPLFLFYNAVMSNGASSNLNNCCILGYHNALGTSVSSPGQTYGVAEFEGRDQTLFSGTADVSILSHEVNEWVNDPSGLNPTPAWGHTGQVSGCQNNFEVGDPLSGTLMPTITNPHNLFTYHLQELAFFSWFYGKNTIAGAGGLFSSNGTFKTDAGAVCK
jgi:hypothetical protein